MFRLWTIIISLAGLGLSTTLSSMDYDWTILKDVGNELGLGKYGILILNCNNCASRLPASFGSYWKSASWRVAVDGGTDSWLEYVRIHNLSLPPPHQVTGDFDSIKPETLEYFRAQKDVIVTETPDQDYTDFHKAVESMLKSSTVKLDSYLVILEHSGSRLDQTFSNINTLNMFELPGYMLTSNALTWLLRPGNHSIHIPAVLREKQSVCGILPFHSATIRSTGLKWNLDDWKVEFGGLISSSNTYDGSPVVTIKTDKTVIWTMSLDDLVISQ